MPSTEGIQRQRLAARNLRLAAEIQYIQKRAAEHDSRVVTVGPLLLFSTESGDAWILDPADRLAARVAQVGEPLPVRVEETETTFAVGWRGRYELVGAAFVFVDDESGGVRTILGYPALQIADRIAEMFG